MARILIIGKSKEFAVECSRLLKQKSHRVTENNDVFEALREAAMDGVDLILWDAPASDPGRARKFAAIKRYHRFIPIIVLDDDKEIYDETLDDKTLLLKSDSTPQQVVEEILYRVPDVVYTKLEFEPEDYSEYVE